MGLLPSPVDPLHRLNATAPSIQRDYRAFFPTTGCSAPVPRIGTLSLARIARLAVSLHIGATVSPVPHKSLVQVHAAFKPEAVRAGLQDSARTHPGGYHHPRF